MFVAIFTNAWQALKGKSVNVWFDALKEEERKREREEERKQLEVSGRGEGERRERERKKRKGEGRDRERKGLRYEEEGCREKEMTERRGILRGR